MSWLIYSSVAAVLVGLGALAAERALRSAGRPARMVWVAAALLTVGLPVAAKAGWTGVGSPGPGVAGVATIVETTPASGVPLGALLVWGWAALSVIGLALIGLQMLRARRESRSWPSGSIAGVRVLVSPATGPATLGVLRPVIVVPRWLFGMSTRHRRLAVLHEQEHRRVGDVLLLNGMAVLLALVPWHPAVWWQAARLHRAIELDCDGRVVSRVRDRAGYGRMLIEAATRRVPAVPLAAALAARSPLLEDRIRSLVAGPRRGSPAVAAAAMVLFAIACALPTPFEPGRGRAVATFGHTATGPDSPAEVTVGTVRAIGTLSRDTAGSRYETGGTYELRELPAGVLRRADPDDPRIPVRPRR